MRLDKLTLGSAKLSPTHQFKNLKDVTIDFDENHWVTVVIGWNGTGKSNVLEALAIIFRDLIMYKDLSNEKKREIPRFAYRLVYRIGSGDNLRHISIDADPDREKEQFIIHVAMDDEAKGVGTLAPFMEDEVKVSALRGKQYKLTAFLAEDYLPKYVFSYYSGESDRMEDVLSPYLKNYYQKLLSGDDPGLKRLFYALPVHSQFVLLAFLIKSNDVAWKFLVEHLGLDANEGIESVLFVLREPPWDSKEGDSRFWNARGVVQRFLSQLYDVALAPIEVTRRIPKSIWNKNQKTMEYKYLFIKDIYALRKLVANQAPSSLFKDLESTYVSELIEEIRIRVKLNKNEDSVTFRELSEGEQQLLTVLGLLHFTAEEESLFLLDEPDTHLNPRCCVDYLKYLQMFVGGNQDNKENSHIILTTHNPLSIAELEKQQVQILYHEPDNCTVRAENPGVDPRGMGFAGIVTSDMFGLGTSLDTTTNKDLLALHQLSTQQTKLSELDRKKLVEIRQRLEGLDFNFASRDRFEQEYLRARFDLATDNGIDGAIVTPENKQKALDALIKSLLFSLQEGQS
jgi:predicted ATPase